MDAPIIIGVGNIYASEALFRAGIHPKRPTGKITKQHSQDLTTTIKKKPYPSN
jgi:formamidopyrimidine-DNA glycosylase